MVAESSSPTLHKISEIYDRIAFAGVGRYNEYDQLRVAGVRAADLKGYQYSRDDVDARSLANQYAQILGQIFTHEMKPMEVEILVAEVGGHLRRRPDVPHQLRRHRRRRARHVVLGGDVATISTRLAEAAGSTPARLARPRRPRCGPPSAPWPDPTARCPPPTWRWRCSCAGQSRRCFKRLTDDERRGPAARAPTPQTPAPAAPEHRRGHRPQQRRGGVLRRLDRSATTRPSSRSSPAPTWRAASTAATRRRCVPRACAPRPTGWRSAPRSSYPDLSGSGVATSTCPRRELRDAVLYQLGALDAFAQVAGAEVAYIKPHGALYHATIDNEAQARAVVAAAAEYDPSLAVLGFPGSALLAAAEREPTWRRCRRRSSTGPTCPTAGSCRGRSTGAVITDPDAVASRPCASPSTARSSPSTAPCSPRRLVRCASTATARGPSPSPPRCAHALAAAGVDVLSFSV